MTDRIAACLRACALLACLGSAGWAQPSTDTPAPAVTAPDSAMQADPLRPWLGWPPLEPAIAIAPLDGPVDWIEKAEIIADRVDDLRRLEPGMDSLATLWDTRLQALATQLELLEDLADLQLGGDLQLQQRIETVRDDEAEALAWSERVDAARSDLEKHITTLDDLRRSYEVQADLLRQKEESR